MRQLANALERGAILAGGPVLSPSHLSLPTPARSTEGGTLAELEREAISRALAEVAVAPPSAWASDSVPCTRS